MLYAMKDYRLVLCLLLASVALSGLMKLCDAMDQSWNMLLFLCALIGCLYVTLTIQLFIAFSSLIVSLRRSRSHRDIALARFLIAAIGAFISGAELWIVHVGW